MSFTLVGVNSLGNKKEVITANYTVSSQEWYSNLNEARFRVNANFSGATTIDDMLDLTSNPPEGNEKRSITFGDPNSDNFFTFTWINSISFEINAKSQGKTRYTAVGIGGDLKQWRFLLVNMRDFSVFNTHFNPTQNVFYYDFEISVNLTWTDTTLGLTEPSDTITLNDYQANYGIMQLKPTYPWKDETTQPGGGQGNWDDDTTETINPPSETDLNTEQLTDTFFMQTYRLRKSELQALGRLLWTPTVTEALSSVFKNPLESIINLFMLPFDKHRTEYKNILLGTYDTGIGGFLVDQYATIDCGVIDIPEKWGGSLDYESRIQLYLPFIGTKELDITEVMGGQLGVKYVVDVLTGACVAYVAVKRGDLEAVLYQFTGNCAYSFPLTQANYNTFYSALLSSTAAVATGIATGGASTPMLVGAGASVAASAKVHVNHSGNLAGNTGYMGIKKPYIILSRPIQALPADFGKYKGYQSHITKRLSDCKGYTEVEYIHLDGISRATSAELSQIESLLKGGVIIS